MANVFGGFPWYWRLNLDAKLRWCQAFRRKGSTLSLGVRDDLFLRIIKENAQHVLPGLYPRSEGWRTSRCCDGTFAWNATMSTFLQAVLVNFWYFWTGSGLTSWCWYQQHQQYQYQRHQLHHAATGSMDELLLMDLAPCLTGWMVW